MAWIRTMLDVYWDLRPCKETQDLYKSKNLTVYNYWNLESKFLTESVWTRNDEFCALPNIDYLLEKYKGDKIILDEKDRNLLKNGWYEDLAIFR